MPFRNRSIRAFSTSPLIVWAAFFIAGVASTGFYDSIQYGPDKGVFASAINSDPATIPRIDISLDERCGVYFTVTFPDVPGLRADNWAYEHSGGAFLTPDFESVTVTGHNRLVLRHGLRNLPGLIMVSTLTAEPGVVEVLASLELAPGTDPGPHEQPITLKPPNLCWSFQRGENFAPGGKVIPNFGQTPIIYHEWIGRCFIFTDDGLTHLNETTRRKTAEVPEDDVRNNPVWPQHYVGVWEHATSPPFPPNISPDRYVIPLLGTVSRDGAHLTAVVNDSARYSAQVWKTCLHHIPKWTPEDAPVLERTWRMKLYGMKNDPEALLRRVEQDFPGIEKLRFTRTDANPSDSPE